MLASRTSWTCLIMGNPPHVPPQVLSPLWMTLEKSFQRVKSSTLSAGQASFLCQFSKPFSNATRMDSQDSNTRFLGPRKSSTRNWTQTRTRGHPSMYLARNCALRNNPLPGLGSILDTVSKDTEDTALSSILSVS